MRKWSVAGKLTRFILGPVLVAAVGVAAAQGNRDHDREHHDNGNHGQKQDDQGDREDHDNGNHGGKHDNGKRGKHDSDFRFQDQDRDRFESHYREDVERWRIRPQGRHKFYRGQRIPDNYRFIVVPGTYYVQAPPPPGYQYGYYDGYVVAYNPTTRVIADVLDLVGAVVNR